MKDMET
ncbi:Protein of unknown function [Bacillus cereus]|nr:Protein of unknown function [Bacillus wiedmannii]SCN43249.1 Protein of unknown function [Bacillus cereus]